MRGVGRFNEVSTSDGAAADNDGIGFRVCGEVGGDRRNGVKKVLREGHDRKTCIGMT